MGRLWDIANVDLNLGGNLEMMRKNLELGNAARTRQEAEDEFLGVAAMSVKNFFLKICIHRWMNK